MRCTDCKLSKETIPAQLHYVYCTIFKKEMSVTTEFKTCQYKESDEYKLKEAIQNYFNNEDNWIVAIKQTDLFDSLATKFNIPNFVQDITASRNFEKKVIEVLCDSEIKIKTNLMVANLGAGGESRYNVLVIQEPQNYS